MKATAPRCRLAGSARVALGQWVCRLCCTTRRKMRCGLGHSARVARGANTTAFAGKGHQVVVPAVVTPCPRKAVGKDAALQILAKRLLDIGGPGVVLALAVELTGACQLQPCLEVLGHCAVQQGALGVAGVVGFGGLSGCSRLSRLGVQRSMLVPTRALVKMLL